jgi:hypothetical protein
MSSPTGRTRWVIVVAVTDGPRRSLAGRVVLPLAVGLTLLWSGTSAQPGMGDAPPIQPTVQATPQLPHGILGSHVALARTAAGHAQHNRRKAAAAAVPAAALAGALAAITRPSWVAGSRRLDRRMAALGPRAPPFPS